MRLLRQCMYGLPSAPSHSWITKLRHTDMVDMDAMFAIGPLR